MRHGFSSPSSRNVHEQSNPISVHSVRLLILSNHVGDWLQTPQSPLSSYFSQQKFPPSPTSRHYPQVSRYFPMNDSQTSVTRDVSEKEFCLRSSSTSSIRIEKSRTERYTTADISCFSSSAVEYFNQERNVNCQIENSHSQYLSER